MIAKAWDHVDQNTQDAFGFIAIDEHTHKGCVIQEATDMGVRLVMIDTRNVPVDFILYSVLFDNAFTCKVIARTEEVIDAWFDCDHMKSASLSSIGKQHVKWVA